MIFVAVRVIQNQYSSGLADVFAYVLELGSNVRALSNL